jgi:alpha-tubulin suppressor-like RCC1 family protein
MDVSKIIFSLQEAADRSTSTLELMTLSKTIEKLKVGTVSVVSSFSQLPTLPLESDGYVYVVENDQEIYYNLGLNWKRVYRRIITYAYAWGRNSYGNLGDGTTTSRPSPITVIGGITNWSQVSAGISHSLGVTSDGIAYAWGLNSVGRLGDGTTVAKSSPVTVIGGITNWSQLSAGQDHSLGVTSDGIAYGWGGASNIFGANGAIGDGTTVAKSSPVTVIGGITNWSQVSAGQNFSLGLTSTGIAYAWGRNSYGRLGDGTTVAKSSPVTVIGGITNWSQLSAGQDHSLGLTATGIAYAWGRNSYGRLGDGTTTSRLSPVTVVGGITNWSQLSAGQSHSLGLTSTGIAYAWGNNADGRLGDGTTTSRLSPVTVVGGITNWSEVSAGQNSSLAIYAEQP